MVLLLKVLLNIDRCKQSVAERVGMFWLFIACLLALVAANQDDKQLDVGSSCPVGFEDSPGCSSTDLMADRGFQVSAQFT